MDSTPALLAGKLVVTRQELADALSTGNFYLEWACIAAALALAWVVGLLARRRAEHYLAAHPPRHFDALLITKPLQMAGPLLTLLYLSIARPFFDHGGIWIEAMAQLTVAYLVARCVILVVQSRFVSYLVATTILVSALLDITGFMPSVTAYLESIAFEIGKIRISLLNFIHGSVILIVVFWLASVSSGTLESYLRRNSRLSYNARELTVKFFRLFVYFIAFMVTLSALGVDLTAFAVFGGALGVGIGLGLQKITANFVSGITLLLEKSIAIGDIVEIGGATGTVRELNIRYVLIETLDGRELMVPNEELISTRVISWTHSHNRARVEIPVGVAYGSDVNTVKRLLLEAARAHPLCLKDPEPKCWLREFGPYSLNFLLAFWVDDIRDGRFGPQSDVMAAILAAFKQNSIDIPFPRQTVALDKG